MTRVLSALIIVGALVTGCDRKESAIQTYDAPKDTAPPPTALGPAQMPGADAAATAATDSGPAPITWTLPAGWKQLPGSQMRYATILVNPDDPKVELTVVPLGAEAAGLPGNITRWAGQLKLPAIPESDYPKYVTQTQVSGELSQVVDLTGSAETGNPPTRLLAAIIPHAGSTWFFTLKAQAPQVEAQKANFLALIHSIQFRDAAPGPSQATASPGPTGPTQPPVMPPNDAVHSGAGAGGAGTAAAGRFKLDSYQTPPGWVEQPGANAMRITSFRTGTGPDSAEVIVSRIGQGQSGNLLSNFNRWRGQVGLGPIQTETDGSMQQGSVAGQPGMFVDYTGPAIDGAAPKQIIVAMTIVGNDDWFIKILGPQSTVSAQADAFHKFVDSLKFSPESK